MLFDARGVIHQCEAIQEGESGVDESVEALIFAARRNLPHDYILAEALTVLPALNPPTLTDSSWRRTPISP